MSSAHPTNRKSRLPSLPHRGRRLALAATLLCGFASAATLAQHPTDQARAALAKLLGVSRDSVKIVQEEAVSWPNGSLGLPQPDMMYTMMVASGTGLILEAKGTRYLYTTSDKAFRFGGPVGLWGDSLLYLNPKEDDPNLNSDLMQASMIGTNPRLVLSGVSAHAAQPGGAVMATRRESRSGFSLLYLPKLGDRKPVVVSGAFAYGAFAADGAGKQWAAVTRPGVGRGWELAFGEIGDAKVKTFGLPQTPSAPTRLTWVGGDLYGRTPAGTFKISLSSAQPKWTPASAPVDDFGPILLNKSQTLEVKTSVVNGQKVARVVKVWFTGSEDVVATIPRLEVLSFSLVRSRWVLVVGKIGDEDAAFVVDLQNGMVMSSLLGRGLGPIGHVATPPAIGRELGQVLTHR